MSGFKSQADRVADLRIAIRKAWKAGQTRSEAANALGVSAGIIGYHARQIGISDRWPAARRGGRS